jgi:hypothetical protein
MMNNGKLVGKNGKVVRGKIRFEEAMVGRKRKKSYQIYELHTSFKKP